MKESAQKVISSMVDANEVSKTLMAYNKFMANNIEDYPALAFF